MAKTKDEVGLADLHAASNHQSIARSTAQVFDRPTGANSNIEWDRGVARRDRGCVRHHHGDCRGNRATYKEKGG